MNSLKIFTGERSEERALAEEIWSAPQLSEAGYYDIIEVQQRPTSDTDATLTKEQADFDKANENLYAILFLVTEKPAALLMARHAEDSRGTRGNRQAVICHDSGIIGEDHHLALPSHPAPHDPQQAQAGASALCVEAMLNESRGCTQIVWSC